VFRRLGFVAFALVLALVASTSFAATVEQVKARGKLLVAVPNFETEPFMFKKEGKLVGFEVDLIEAIAKELGVPYELVVLPWDGGIALAWDKAYGWDKFDMAVANITIKDARAEVCDFSTPYFLTGQVIVFRKNAPIAKVEDILKKKVGVMSNSTGEEAAKNILKDVQIVGYPDANAMTEGLKKGEVDGAVIDETWAMTIVKTNPDLDYLKQLLTKERYGVAVKKGSDLKALVDKVIEAKRDELSKKWLQ